jgi:hypothetical protein
MSHPADSTDPGAPQILSGTRHELHRRGRALGFEYDVDIRITELADAEMEPVASPLLPEARRLVLPGAAQSTDEPAPDGVDRWDAEGGAVT